MISSPRALFSLFALAAFFVLCVPCSAATTATLASVFSDHMVLQRDKRILIWGEAGPGDQIRLELTSEQQDGSTTHALASVDVFGGWTAYFGPLSAGGPYRLTGTLSRGGVSFPFAELSDILLGDVWLCSGQSNMGFTLGRGLTGKQDTAQSSNSQIRLLQVKQTVRPRRSTKLDGSPQWQVCSPDTASSFSAVAYYFGRDLQKHLNIPVGLIQSSVGGTSAECWMSLEGLSGFPEFDGVIKNLEREATDPDFRQQRYERELAAWRASKQLTTATATAARTTSRTRTVRQPTPEGFPRRPTVLYNGMIAPLVPYALKGVIWYQGESNVSRAHRYRRLFPALIQNWRDDWHEPTLPFLFAQLPYFHARKPQPADDTWAELRDAQLFTARSVPNTGMAITYDTGDAKDIHPKDKEPVGARLALAARGVAYGEKLEWSGPLFTTATIEGASMRIHFDHIGSGLTTIDKSPTVRGFAIAGADQKYVWADAKLDSSSNTVLVSSAAIANPVAVRYAWAANPDANLANREGLPASPFRTDSWTGISDGNTKDSVELPQ